MEISDTVLYWVKPNQTIPTNTIPGISTNVAVVFILKANVSETKINYDLICFIAEIFITHT